MDRQTLGSRARQALTMLDFPAPDGAATMNRVPRTGPGIRDSGFGIREDKSLPQHYEANRNRFCESRIPNSQSRLLNVLHLLADLVTQHLRSEERRVGKE